MTAAQASCVRLFPERVLRDNKIISGVDERGNSIFVNSIRARLCEEADRLGIVPGRSVLAEAQVLSLPTARLIAANAMLSEDSQKLQKLGGGLQAARAVGDAIAFASQHPHLCIHTDPLARFELLSLINFVLSGERVFRLSQPLAEALDNTELRVRASDIRLPFPAIYLVLDFDDLRLSHPDGTSAPIEGVLLLDIPEVFVDNKATQSAGHALTSIACSRPLADTRSNTRHSSFFYGDENRIVSSATLPSFLNSLEGESTRTWQLILNSLLYLSSPDAEVDAMDAPSAPLIQTLKDVTSTKRAAKLKRQIARMSDLPYALAGKSIVVDQNQHAPSEGQTLGHHWQLGYRIQVRGHWRQQACGPGRSLRQNIWIQPHWKGPDTAQLVHRDYLLKQRTNNEAAPPERGGERPS